MDKTNIIYYHNPCQDGLLSMFVAIQKLEDYELVPFTHGHTINTEYNSKVIYFLDMAPSKSIYDELIKNNIVIILDHHVTNMKDYQNVKGQVYFDMNKSGVGMCWSYFFPGEEMPYYMKLVQDRDLWKFEYPETKSFCEGLYFSTSSTTSLEENIEILQKLYKNLSSMNYYIELGNLLLKNKDNKIKYLTDKFIEKVYNYKGHKVCMVNVENDLVSDLGNALSSRPECDFAILWRYDHVYEKYNISMRSANKVDVSQICKQFGGGGHKNAAGCSISEHPIKIFHQSQKNNLMVDLTDYTYFT
jgi:oligoribonuclease NrnB/cAMP/cGMP phosphodiesterase (DHH superfamily)